ncbi:MAG: hypothetical protein ABIQ98_00620 [Sphingomicrobium sp.]
MTILAPFPSTDLTGIEGRALIDTGSTTTGVSARIARALELPKRGKRPIGSIQGEGQAERFQFRVGFKIPATEPAFPFVFDELIGFELIDSFALEALIGMDVLRQCDLSIRRGGASVLAFGRH